MSINSRSKLDGYFTDFFQHRDSNLALWAQRYALEFAIESLHKFNGDTKNVHLISLNKKDSILVACQLIHDVFKTNGIKKSGVKHSEESDHKLFKRVVLTDLEPVNLFIKPWELPHLVSKIVSVLELGNEPEEELTSKLFENFEREIHPFPDRSSKDKLEMKAENNGIEFKPVFLGNFLPTADHFYERGIYSLGSAMNVLENLDMKRYTVDFVIKNKTKSFDNFDTKKQLWEIVTRDYQEKLIDEAANREYKKIFKNEDQIHAVSALQDFHDKIIELGDYFERISDILQDPQLFTEFDINEEAVQLYDTAVNFIYGENYNGYGPKAAKQKYSFETKILFQNMKILKSMIKNGLKESIFTVIPDLQENDFKSQYSVLKNTIFDRPVLYNAWSKQNTDDIQAVALDGKGKREVLRDFKKLEYAVLVEFFDDKFMDEFDKFERLYVFDRVLKLQRESEEAEDRKQRDEL